MSLRYLNRKRRSVEGETKDKLFQSVKDPPGRGGDVNAHRTDSDGYRRDGGYADGRNGRRRSDGYPQPDPRREQRNRQASVGLGTGDFQVYVSVGGWFVYFASLMLLSSVTPPRRRR